MRLIEGGRGQASLGQTIGEGLLLTLLAVVMAFAVGFGFWGGVYLLERVVG
jgi:hypothetical protein